MSGDLEVCGFIICMDMYPHIDNFNSMLPCLGITECNWINFLFSFHMSFCLMLVKIGMFTFKHCTKISAFVEMLQ